MLKRTLTGALLVALAVACYLLDALRPGQPAWCVSVLGAVLMLGALRELLVIGTAKPERRVMGMVAGVLWLGLLVTAGLRPGTVLERVGDLLAVASLVASLLMISQIRYGPGPASHQLSRSLWFQVPYVGGLGCLVALAMSGALDLALGVTLIAKSSDIGAYLVGRTLGRRPLAPKISPKKTIAGAVGGLLVPALLAPILLPSIAGVPVPGGVWGAAVHGAVLGILAMLSDLSASLIKRSHDVKDSGSIFGESGGLFDLADSLLLVGPIMLAYTAVLA